MHKDSIANLNKDLQQLKKAAEKLEISQKRCEQMNVMNENHLIELEALTSRYARLIDLLIHKVYRAIDVAEFTEGGTLIDALNRAEKRKLIDSIKEMRLFKDLRNDIAHEYIFETAPFDEVLKYTPKALDLANRAISYCYKFKETF